MSVQIRIAQLQNLVHPVNELDVRVAAHLAENRCRFDRLVPDLIELAEQGSPTDLRHCRSLLPGV
jgi:hypothetical protein